jgi:anaerobic magnesium-protoporphyrin IX monomethyl ester cyclase
MKIALISPEYYDVAHFGIKRKEIPPFGVLYLASVLKEKGLSVSLYRVSLEKYFFDFSNYDIVGFSISSSVTYPIIKKVREYSIFNPESLLIAGGIHTTLFAKEVINELVVHISCIGEGEKTISEIIDNFETRKFDDILAWNPEWPTLYYYKTRSYLQFR